MLAKRIIPCLDVNEGRVVKGINFVNLRDAGDPVESGLRYSEEGADELVFLDITASLTAETSSLKWFAELPTASISHSPSAVDCATLTIFRKFYAAAQIKFR